MRIALISDLHANEVALRAVVNDIERVGADQTICLGDVATLGPNPHYTIETVRSFGTPVILGNHDAFMLDAELIRTYTDAPIVVDSVTWAREQLSEDELAFFRTFLPSLHMQMDGGHSLFLFHGTPRSNMEDLLATTAPDVVDEMLDGNCAEVMVGGHTHIQMMRQHRGNLIVNTGSVGAPFKEYVGGRAPVILPHAEYAVIDSSKQGVQVELHRVPLDRHALLAASGSVAEHPMREAMMAQYR